ncbi:MAG: hypothetical protein KOO63_10060 [Bacteroidales bacterium]|nr:hypothetical protein [Candidatus Latescibacterota bacterium]
MRDYRVLFDDLEWESPMPGVRHKVVDHGGNRLRLVEYSDQMELHWCNRGHVGIILDGRMEIEFDSGIFVYSKDDGVFIPDGEEHRHRGRVLSGTMTALFVEKT